MLDLLDFLEFEKAVQLADARRMAHFAERFGLDLADTFAGHSELPAHFFKSARVAIAQTESQLQDFSFPLIQTRKDVTQFVAQEAEAGDIGRVFGGFFLDEITKTR